MSSLAPITVPDGSELWINYPVGKDADGNQETITGRSASVDNYAAAFVANVPGSGSGQLYVVSKGTIPQGGSVSVNVTISATNAAGNQISVVQPVTFQGPPLPPPAVTLTITAGVQAANAFNTPADPGQASITF